MAGSEGGIDAEGISSGGHTILNQGGTVNIGAAPKQLSPLHQLPSPPAIFTGRDEELNDLLNQLASATTHGATISAKHAGLQGMGGVGKTALATVLAHRLKDRYPDAQIFFNLRGADPDRRVAVPPSEAMQHIIHCFHPEARLPDTLDALTPLYLSVLTDAGRVLLLLDNAADEYQIKPLLPPPNCLLLVTSRQRIQLPGLTARDLDCLKPEKSQELLLKLAPRIKGHEAKAAELCGHLPLKLEVFGLAVLKNTTYSVAQLLQLLGDRKQGLAPEDAAFQVSYELLAEDLRRQWALLAVFTASFDHPAAAAIWEMTEDSTRAAMQTLINASLVEFNESNGRFRLHDLVRQFCNGKLSEAEREKAHMRHAAHYRTVAGQADALFLEKGKTISGLELFDRDRVHIEAAFEWLKPRRDQPSADLLISLVDGVAYTGSLRFHARQQRIPWLEAQRDTARVTKDRAAEGRALGNLGSAYVDLSEPRKAIEICEQALVIDREIGNRRWESVVLGNLGNAYTVLGEPRKAIEFYEQALVIDCEIGNRRGEGADLGNLGVAYKNLGEPRKAIEFYEQQLKIVQEIGDRHGERTALGNLGVAYHNLGEPRKAIEFYEQQLKIVREIGDRSGEGAALGNLGIAYTALREPRKAIEFCEQALVIDREIGNRRWEGVVLGNLGDTYADLGEPRKAIEFYEQQLKIAREIGDRRWEGTALFHLALALDKLDDRTQAINRASAALQIFEAIEEPNAAKVSATLGKWRTQG
jgi:tetratricopeptide (TPR) repeat protein